MKRVTLTATYPSDLLHPLHRRLAQADGPSRADLLMWGPMSTVTTLLWLDAGPDATAAVLDAVESVTATHLVPADGGTYAFVHQTDYEFDPRLLDLVAESKVVFLPPIEFRDAGRVRFEVAGESALLGEFYDGLTDLLDAEIEAVREFRRGRPTTVTDRQRAALEAAVAAGYYDVPRTGTVADVAAELGCAHSTAGELLRRAESAVLTAFVGSDRASASGGIPSN